jgi:CheY-like chemotaxis protein
MSHILIVEDDADLRCGIKDILKRAGHRVLEACDGSAVSPLLTGEPIDLVITDILMPEQEGIQTIVQIRHSDPDIKIIGMSGGGTEGAGGATHYLEMAREFGAHATLQKPFGKTQLLALVDELLGTAV